MMRGCIGAFGRSVCPGMPPRVGKNGALQRVGPAKTSRKDNGVWRRVVHGIFRTRMSWQNGANGLVGAALRGRRAALSDQGPVGWQDRSRQAHRAVAGWAARPGCGAGRSGIRGRPGVELEWHSGMDLNALALGFGGRMAEAVVANRAQAGGQDMAQIAAHEFGAG